MGRRRDPVCAPPHSLPVIFRTCPPCFDAPARYS